MSTKPDSKYQEKIKEEVLEFSSFIQKGDFGLAQLIEYGFILYGQTRTGKTVTGHHLSGNPLKGIKVNGQDMVMVTTERNRNARIGNQTSSETMVPNFFVVKLKKKYGNISMHVIDTPGYGDTYGVLRILANGFYHYRLYSKVQNMKFILCIDHSHIRGTCEKFLDTIMKFTSSFKNYLDQKQEIWKSCCFLFTKVDESEGDILTDLKDKLKAIISTLKTQLSEEQQEAIKEFVKFIIDEERIFFIKKVRKGQTPENQNLLEKIDQKVSDWWSRSISKEKPSEVDMSKIQFSLYKDIIIETTRNERSKSQFMALIEFYNKCIKDFVQISQSSKNIESYSLSIVLDELVKDAMGAPDSHNFLNLMKKYVDQNYAKFDKSYNEERIEMQKKMFDLSSGDIASTSTLDSKKKAKKLADKNYILKKFNVLKNVEQIKANQNSKVLEHGSMKFLEEYQQAIYQIIREFNRVAYKRKDSVEIIYKYGYIVHRIFDEAKVLILLIDSDQNDANKSKKILEASDGKYIDLFRPIKDFLGVEYVYGDKFDLLVKDLHEDFVKQFDPKSKNFDGLVLNEPLIEFITQVTVADDIVTSRILPLIIRYSDQVLRASYQNHQVDVPQINRLIRRLSNARFNSIELYEISVDEINKKDSLMRIRKITSNIGKLLQLTHRYRLARKVYASIKYVDSVSRLFQVQINAIKVDMLEDLHSIKTAFDLRIEYSEYLGQHGRQAKGLEVLQQAFELVNSYEDLQNVKQRIGDMLLKIRDTNNSTKYETQLFADNYFERFDVQFDQELCSLS